MKRRGAIRADLAAAALAAAAGAAGCGERVTSLAGHAAHEGHEPHVSRGTHEGHAPRGPTAVAHSAPLADGEPVTCACEEARTVNGWCRACQVGYVALVPISSPLVFDAIDAHGHEFEPDSLTCAACRKALADEGFCDRHARGFADGMLYASRPAWALARGEPVDVAAIACERCRRHAESRGWCAACRVGMIGRASFRDRAAFDVAAAEQDRLRLAATTVERCEMCAACVITGATCPVCKQPAS